LKDVTPQGNADQPAENTKPDNSGGSDGEGKVPEGNQHPLKIELPQQPSQPGKITQPKEAKPPKPIQYSPNRLSNPSRRKNRVLGRDNQVTGSIDCYARC
jgi:hypothetical protein